MNKASLFLFFISCTLLLTSFDVIKKADTIIVLQDEKLNFVPREFYIADVVDNRQDRSSVALLIAKNASNIKASQTADLPGGAAAGIRQFINRNLNQNTALRPVVITIKQFKLTESLLAGGQISGHLSVVFSFDLQLNDITRHLVDYSGGMRYSRPEAQTDAVEPTLRYGIENAMAYFNKWINQQVGTNPLLAKEVRVKFSDYTEKPEGDTIYYSVNRPLTWDDFKEKPRASNFEAEVFASIGYTEQAEVVRGIFNLSIAMKVDMAKSDCWVKNGVSDDYILNHEQRHFDIEKLISEHFKQKIMAMKLPVDNFDGLINVEYLETLREATRMQKQYDYETKHGSDRIAQAQWNEKIDRELRDCGVKN